MTREIPGRTIEERENQMINLAVDLVEKQLRDGTAAPSLIQHYLKLGTTSYKYELEKLQNENALLKARKENIYSQQNAEQAAKEAIEAMRRYSGHYDDDTDEML